LTLHGSSSGSPDGAPDRAADRRSGWSSSPRLHGAFRPKGRALTLSHQLEDLEEELIRRLYLLRDCEQAILGFEPQSSAPASLRQTHAEARVAVHQLEAQIRRLRHRY